MLYGGIANTAHICHCMVKHGWSIHGSRGISKGTCILQGRLSLTRIVVFDLYCKVLLDDNGHCVATDGCFRKPFG